MNEIELSGIDGTNPLGFLAALGTLVTLHEGEGGEQEARLGWRRQYTWVPVLYGCRVVDQQMLATKLENVLKGRAVDPLAETRRRQEQEAFDKAKKKATDKKKEISKRKLKGKDREETIEMELRPLEKDLNQKRLQWLAVLKDAVPSPELALGKRPDCTPLEFREYAQSFLDDTTWNSRRAIDLLAAFGSDAQLKKKDDAIEPTPFCFISGSGQQWFLDTARQLMGRVAAEGIQRTLFERWTYPDRKLSMRWDPIEDRQYALMDTDPTSEDARTEWMANLLAYRALVLFPCAPTRRGLGTTGWSVNKDGWFFTWPIWQLPASPDTIRSLLQLAELRGV